MAWRIVNKLARLNPTGKQKRMTIRMRVGGLHQPARINDRPVSRWPSVKDAGLGPRIPIQWPAPAFQTRPIPSARSLIDFMALIRQLIL